MSPQSPQHSPRFPTVSLLSDRTGDAKVTMQTRIAVMEKDPHRFQVIPLREAPPPEPANPRGHRRNGMIPPPQKIAVHMDSSPTGKLNRSAQSNSRRKGMMKPPLQSKDMNRDMPKASHRKAGSLELDQQYGSTDSRRASEPRVPSSTPGPSQLVNPYSFRLKPWTIPGVFGDIGSGRSLISPSRTLPVTRADRTHTTQRSTSPPPVPSAPTEMELCEGVLELTQDIHGLRLEKARTHRAGGADWTQKSLKRHAIYAHPDIVVLGNDTGELPPLSEEVDYLNEASCNGNLDAQVQAVDRKSLSDTEVLSSRGRNSLCSTRPLNIIRKSTARCLLPIPNSDIEYSEVLKVLLADVENAIHDWDSFMDL